MTVIHSIAKQVDWWWQRIFLFSIVVLRSAVAAKSKQSFTVFQKKYPCVIYSCHTTDKLSMVLLAFVNLVPDNSADQSFWLLTYRTGLSRATPLETCHSDSLYSDRASLLTSDWTEESKFVFTHFDSLKTFPCHMKAKNCFMCAISHIKCYINFELWGREWKRKRKAELRKHSAMLHHAKFCDKPLK